jgi:ribosomal RNA-processing protein 9
LPLNYLNHIITFQDNIVALRFTMPPSSKRPRSKFKVDLSGHGGQYEDVVDDITPPLNDEDIESDDDDDDLNVGQSSEESEDEEETADSKRLRMAREYLNKLEAQHSASDEGESDSDDQGESDEDGAPVDKVGKRIAKERLRKSGLLQSRIADSVLEGIQSMRCSFADAGNKSAEACAKSWIDAKYVTYLRGHDLTPTCVALSHQGNKAFSGAKDGSLIMWNVEDGKKTTIIPATKGQHAASLSDRNEREILAIAISDDDRYLAVGGRDNCVRIFDVRKLGKSNSPLTTMEGHKKPVTALAFRSRSLDLYSGSEDRCIRRYDLSAMTYVETLYGHQSPIVAIGCANKNRPVSIARDRTVRVWKVEEDSHLVYRGGGDVGSAECLSAIQDGWFVTGHDDGRLLLWKEEKKRPVGDVITAAHGLSNGVTRSVISCGALALSDVLATGSNDGYLRLWKVSWFGTLEHLMSISI